MAPPTGYYRRTPRQLIAKQYVCGTWDITETPYTGGYKEHSTGWVIETLPSKKEMKRRKDDEDEASRQLQDPTVAAMVELLSRQAIIVLEIHDALASKPNQSHGLNVDEDLLRRRINDITSICNSKFYSYRYDLVPLIWRRLYTDSLILETHLLLLRPLLVEEALSGDLLDEVVEKFDRAVITAGPDDQSRFTIESIMTDLEKIWEATLEGPARPWKRQRREYSLDKTFSTDEPFGRPELNPMNECPHHSKMPVHVFEDYMMNADEGTPKPIVFTDLMDGWGALNDRPWNSPNYLLARTFGGRRLVPVEIGRSYVDDGWGQELIPFRTFIEQYIESPSGPVGYLAQHDLFKQIPNLRNDTIVPDHCWAEVPPHPTDPNGNHPTLELPLMNAWFGPAKTITPLHTDAYHNLLCQVVGTKYVRLYPPQATAHMKPRAPEHGVDMSNTSELDVGVLEGWDERPEGVTEEDVQRMKEELKGVEYKECILGPGETLVIPIGWWHYVRSLSVSFSVSFWWN